MTNVLFSSRGLSGRATRGGGDSVRTVSERITTAQVREVAKLARLTLDDDVVGEVLDRDEVLGVAPSIEDHRFRVPPIIGLDD